MSSAPRYLVISPQGLGDSLEATPIVRALKLANAEAIVDVAVTRPGPRLLYAGLQRYVADVLYLPYWEAGLWPFVSAVLAQRRGRRYDASFLAYPSGRRAYEVLLLAFAARRRFAHRHYPRMLLDWSWTRATLVPVRTVANVERNRDLLRAAGIVPDGLPGYLVPDDWVDTPSPRSTRRIAVHVGSIVHDGLAAKRWPLRQFSLLCRRLVADGYEVVLIVGPDERADCDILLAEVPGVTSFAGSLPDVARYLSRCALVVANDNGIAHLAAAVRTPVVTLFGPTPTEFGPFSPEAVALRPSLCPPCFDVRRPVVTCVRNIDFACLADLNVELVHQTVTARMP